MEPNQDAPPGAMRRLEFALVIAVAEVVLQIAVLTARGAWSGAPLRIGFLAAKLPFCYFAWHRRPGAYLAVWLFEFGAVVAASVVHGALLPRIAFAGIALAAMVLLGRGASAFPPVEWRSR